MESLVRSPNLYKPLLLSLLFTDFSTYTHTVTVFDLYSGKYVIY